MSVSHEIRTIEEFRAVTRQPLGVVVITDPPTRTVTAHTTACPHVTEGYFTTKVIDGGGKNGSYFYYLRYEDAARETGANGCGVCSGSPREGSDSLIAEFWSYDGLTLSGVVFMEDGEVKYSTPTIEAFCKETFVVEPDTLVSLTPDMGDRYVRNLDVIGGWIRPRGGSDFRPPEGSSSVVAEFWDGMDCWGVVYWEFGAIGYSNPTVESFILANLPVIEPGTSAELTPVDGERFVRSLRTLGARFRPR